MTKTARECYASLAKTSTQRTVVCIKWGKVFGADEVNILFRACRKHSKKELHFVCLTDNSDGLVDGIEIRPIPNIGLTADEWRRPGVWPKLSLFSPELEDLGRVLFLDLDMMIVGDLEPFFQPTDGSVFLNMGQSWRPNPQTSQKEPGTAIFSFDPAMERSVLTTFLADKASHINNYRNEQDFVGAHVSKVSYWPEGLVVSFKRHLCHRNGKGLFVKPKPPSERTSVVAFHGTPRPAETMQKLVWGPFPHFHSGRVPWIADYRRTFLIG